jgi:predicted nuclease of predicted toxin-antitoxin system
VRFLVDRCAGQRLAEWLREHGHDVVEARSRGADPGDRAILEWARSEDRILVTMDKDFGALIYAESAEHAGLVRLPHVRSSLRLVLIQQVLSRYGEALHRGAIVP